MRPENMSRDIDAARRRGAKAMHEKTKPGPIIDSYVRKVDIRGQFEREETERRSVGRSHIRA